MVDPHELQEEQILNRGLAVMSAEAAAIASARSRLGESFVEATKLILQLAATNHPQGRLCVTGVGKAGLIGRKIQATFASTGTPAYFLHPVEALHGDLGMVQGCDVVLGFSKSGGSELRELLPRLKEIGCRVIIVTGNPESETARVSDYIIHIGEEPEACPLGLAPSSSAAAMLAIGDALALTVMEQRAVGREEYAAFHPAGALGRSLSRVSQLMRTEENCPMLGPDATLNQFRDAVKQAPKRAGAVLVVGDNNELLGIVTQGDVFRALIDGGDPKSLTLRDVMTSSPKLVRGDDLSGDAVALMREYLIDELPVVDSERRVLGLLDIQDLARSGFSVLE